MAETGPDPFTDSTAKSTETPAPVTRTPQPPSPSGTASATAQGMRPVDGATPGLYGGTQSAGSCDVEKQVAFLTSDPTKERAFAHAEGISAASVPGFLRGLTPVVLRADTRVTNHGYRSGEATGFQSVLQAGTAVLVDDRGMPRVRCACGNPLSPPVAFKGTPNTQGQQWSGYRPTQVVVVTPTPKPVTNLVIVNVTDNTWIERKVGDDGQHDKRVPPPPMPKPHPSDSSDSSASPSTSPPPSSTSPSPSSSTGPPDTSSSASPPSSQPPSSEESAPASEPASPPTSAPGDAGDPHGLASRRRIQRPRPGHRPRQPGPARRQRPHPRRAVRHERRRQLTDPGPAERGRRPPARSGVRPGPPGPVRSTPCPACE